MKSLTLIIALIFSVSVSYAQDAEKANNITITINNIKNNNGHVVLSLHTADTFMKGAGIKSAKSEVVDGTIKVTFENVEAGTYAIMALHDENDNNRMDYSENGRPKESYGMSNNPMSYGPPQYDAAKFELSNQDLEFDIVF